MVKSPFVLAFIEHASIIQHVWHSCVQVVFSPEILHYMLNNIMYSCVIMFDMWHCVWHCNTTIFDIVWQYNIVTMYAGFQLMKASTDSPGVSVSTGLAAPGANCTILPWPFWSYLRNCLLENTYMETLFLVIANISWFSCDLFNLTFPLFIMTNINYIYNH
jgi:hypothetical protein